jgi:CheY-like chemotaxis protein
MLGAEQNLLYSDKIPEQTKNFTAAADGNSERNPLVLVLGTDEDTRLLFRTALDVWDCRTLEAATAEQAFRIAAERRPDLVLLDMELVISKSISLLRKLRRSDLFENIPFILLSGHIQKDVRRTVLAAGASDLLVKPIDFGILENTLKGCLPDRKSAGKT